ncbi:MAG TPA: response regulator [Candidatus Binatia bacterium]|nr:response regulator [Candidatus Binatia bacterium]
MTKQANAPVGPRILVVEDHPLIAELIETRLRIEGLRPTKALGGAEAISRLDTEQFDLVILDIMMPDVDGYQVLAHIRNTEATRALPVIFLTARSSPDDVERGLRMGADHYMTKPFSGADLVRRVKILLAERKLGATEPSVEPFEP